MATYNINSLLSKDKKEVELLDGTILDLTFSPNIVNRLYTNMMDKQYELQDLTKEYRNHMKKVQDAKNKEELKDTKEYLNKSKEITDKVKQLTTEVQDKLKDIIRITVEENDNDIVIDDDWYDSKTKEEINMLIQIIFDMVKEEDKKK